MLLKAIITNFKGLKERTFEFDMKEASFAGTNASFKTTLFDAVMWATTGKNHLGESDFEIKTREGDEIRHHLHHSVELEFENFSTKRDYFEIWKTKRGTTEKKFDGHTTDYFIDRKNGLGLIKCEKESEFLDFMADQFGGKDYVQNFLLSSNPSYFSQVLEWKQRRALIFKMVKPITDAEVFEALPEFPILPKLLCSGAPDVLLTALKKRLNDLNKEMTEVGIRIDETFKQIPETTESKEALETAIQEKKNEITAKREELKKIEVAVDLVEKLGKAEKELSDAKRRFNDEQTEKKRKHDQTANVDFDKYQKTFGELSRAKQESEFGIAQRERERAKLVAEQAELEKSFNDTTAQKWNGSETCPTCKQLLPDSEIEKLTAEFNGTKSRKLQKIIKDAENIKNLIEGLSQKKFRDPAEIQSELDKLVKPEFIKFQEDTADYSKLEEAIKLAREEIKQSKDNIAERQKPVLEAITALETDIFLLNQKVGVFADIDQKKQRIEMHKKRQAELSDQYAVTAEQVDAIQAFIIKKVDLMEDDIFKVFGVKFSMFERLINGGLKEECRILVDCNGTLIPYDSANNAGKINVGVKLCSVFQKYFGIEAPIFVDNAESIVKIEETDCQIVKLIVDEKYQTLTRI